MIEVSGLAADVWHDLYEAADIAVGTPLIIYNKGSSTYMLWEGASAPPNPSNGVPLDLSEPQTVSSGNPGVWIRGMIPVSVNVQVIT